MITKQDVLNRIADFKQDDKYNIVDSLGHVVLSDFNLSDLAIQDQLADWLANHADEWVTEQMDRFTPFSDKYTEVAARADYWSQVYSIIGLLTWLLYDVPEDVRLEVQESVE